MYCDGQVFYVSDVISILCSVAKERPVSIERPGLFLFFEISLLIFFEKSVLNDLVFSFFLKLVY